MMKWAPKAAASNGIYFHKPKLKSSKVLCRLVRSQFVQRCCFIWRLFNV